MDKPDGRKRMALALLCAAVFLDSMDLSLMGVALPAIGRDLSLSEGTLQWLVSGYAVAYGGFLLLGGRMADLFGRRRVFLLSLAVFAAASLVGGLLSDGWALVVTRVVKGLARRSPPRRPCHSSPRHSPKAPGATGRSASTPWPAPPDTAADSSPPGC